MASRQDQGGTGLRRGTRYRGRVTKLSTMVLVPDVLNVMVSLLPMTAMIFPRPNIGWTTWSPTENSPEIAEGSVSRFEGCEDAAGRRFDFPGGLGVSQLSGLP